MATGRERSRADAGAAGEASSAYAVSPPAQVRAVEAHDCRLPPAAWTGFREFSSRRQNALAELVYTCILNRRRRMLAVLARGRLRPICRDLLHDRHDPSTIRRDGTKRPGWPRLVEEAGLGVRRGPAERFSSGCPALDAAAARRGAGAGVARGMAGRRARRRGERCWRWSPPARPSATAGRWW